MESRTNILLPFKRFLRPSPFGIVILAVLLRIIPVVLSWPYAVGFDTNELYLRLFATSPPSIAQIIENQSLIWAILNGFYKILPEPFVILDVLAIAIQASLGVAIYYYSIKVAKLSERSSFLVATLFTFSLLTLRLTWDQYRMGLGLLFAVITFILLTSDSNLLKLTALPTAFLVFISNLEPSIFFLLSLILCFTVNRLTKPRRIVSAELLVIGLSGVLLAFQAFYVRSYPGVRSQTFGITPFDAISSLGFLLFTTWPILLLLPLFPFKKLQYHNLWFFGVLLFALVIPFTGVVFDFEPDAVWLYWMIGFPVAVFFGQVFESYYQKLYVRRIATFALAFFVISSVAYVSTSPLLPSPYNLLATSYANDFPVGYLQSTVPISQESSLLNLIKSTMRIIPLNSTLYMPDEFYGFIFLLPNPNSSRVIDMGDITGNANFLTLNLTGSFTIWWTEPTGWYGVTSLPNDFRIVESSGPFSLFQIA